MISFARFIALLLPCIVSIQCVHAQYTPPDKALYDTVMHLDSLFFGAYNSCSIHLKEYGDFYADNLEFYHDQGGLNASKQEVIEATRKNICGKVTRKLVPGSVEIYPIANFGAIEIGYHTFHNSTQPPEAKPHPGRFVIIWNRTKEGWKITRVISLH
jgi:hypothetical protein